MTFKAKYTTSNFEPWGEKVLAKVKKNITELKRKIKPKQAKSVVSDPNIKKHLKELYLKL